MCGDKQGRGPQVSRAEGSAEHAGLTKQVGSETKLEKQSPCPSLKRKESMHAFSSWVTVNTQTSTGSRILCEF